MSSNSQRVEEMTQELLQNPSSTFEFIQYLLRSLGPEGQQWVDSRILRAHYPNDAELEFAESIGARQIEPSQQKALELASLTNFFSYRKKLLSDSIPATQAAAILGVSRTTIHDRIKAASL